jgi:hypothetical protein
MPPPLPQALALNPSPSLFVRSITRTIVFGTFALSSKAHIKRIPVHNRQARPETRSQTRLAALAAHQTASLSVNGHARHDKLGQAIQNWYPMEE